MLRVVGRRTFVASNAPTNIVKGREDRKVRNKFRNNFLIQNITFKLMAPEYISPQQQAPHSLWKRLVRQDCLRRRQHVDIPEFYPGSILAIVYADKFAPDKKLRFVGRVLHMTGFGTNHKVYINLFF